MSAAFPSLALVRRELLTTLRGPRAFGMLLLFAAVAVVVALVSWPDQSDDRGMVQWQSQQFMRNFLNTLFWGTMLCVPAFAAGAIVLERERKTFELLRMTLVRPSGVVASKLMNAVGFFFLLMVGLVPIAATTFFLVGVDARQFGASLLVIASSAVSCASVGLLCSALGRRTLVSIALSYVGVAALSILPLVLLFIGAAGFALFMDIRSVAGIVEDVAPMVVPYIVLTMNWWGATVSVIPVVAYQALAALACLALAHRRVSRPMNPPKVELRKPVDDKTMLRERRTTWPYYLIDPLRRKKPIEDGRNPMMVREVRWGLINRGSILIRLFYIAATIYFFVGVMTSTASARDISSLRVWFITQCVLTIVVAPALTANTVTKELELGNLDMLRMTLLRPREIVTGKFIAAVFTMFPMLLAAFSSLLPVALLVKPQWQVVAMGYGTLLVCAMVALSVAIFFSTLLRRTLPAIVWSYVACAILFYGLGEFMFRYQSFALRQLDHLGARYFASSFSPVGVLATALEKYRSGPPEFGVEFWLMRSGAWMAVAVGFLGIAWYLFARNRMRDE